MLKKLIVILFVVLAVDFFVGGSATAVNFQEALKQQTGAFAGTRGADYPKPVDPRLFVAQIIQYLLGLVTILFISFTIYAGYLIMTSAGEQDKVDKGKKILRYAVIGALVTLSAYSLLLLVGRLGQTTVEPSSGPSLDVQFDTRYFNPCASGAGDPLSCGNYVP